MSPRRQTQAELTGNIMAGYEKSKPPLLKKIAENVTGAPTSINKPPKCIEKKTMQRTSGPRARKITPMQFSRASSGDRPLSIEAMARDVSIGGRLNNESETYYQ